MKLLKQLSAQIAAVSMASIKAPKTEVKPGEVVVGVLPASLRKFHAVHSRRIDALQAQCKKSHQILDRLKKAGKGKESPKDLLAGSQHALAHEEMELVSKLYWLAVRQAFPVQLAVASGVGLRKGWKVVRMPAQESRGIELETNPLGAILALSLLGAAMEHASGPGRG